MKKSTVVSNINWIINNDESENLDEPGLRILSYLEDIGMLTPTCTVTIKDGKHTPTERRWDDEE